MAMYRYGAAEVVVPSIDTKVWQKYLKSCGNTSKVAKTVLGKYSPSKYLLSHCTIVGAVETELADPKKSSTDFYIHPSYSDLINNNGDAWSKKMLAASYRTFIGSNNYLEHVQIPELSKGKVIDAVLREVPIGKDKLGNELTTYYTDILVATERRHKSLIAGIESGVMNSLSMGCRIAFSICSKCGNKAVDDTEACEHVRYQKNSTFFDDHGVQRKVAELCGHFSEEGSVTFIDASWVEKPAFTGAVIRNIIAPPEQVMAKIEEASKKKAFLFKEGDFLKAAAKKEDEPVEDAPAKEEDDDSSAEMDNSFPGEESATPEEEPALDQNSADLWKSRIKDRLLRDIGDEIIQELSGEPESNSNDLETLDESLIRPTASVALKQMYKMKKSWDNYLCKTANCEDKKLYEKLKFGTYMILTGSDLTSLSEYGYNRRDFLAVMSFLDRCFNKPLNIGLKKAIAELNGTDGLDLDTTVYSLQKIAGKRLNDSEVERSLTWLRAMDSYPV